MIDLISSVRIGVSVLLLMWSWLLKSGLIAFCWTFIQQCLLWCRVFNSLLGGGGFETNGIVICKVLIQEDSVSISIGAHFSGVSGIICVASN